MSIINVYSKFKKHAIIWVSASFVLLPAESFAEASEKITTLQNRVYNRTHELTAFAGVIPDDQFFISYPITGAYTFNLNDWLAWEAIRGRAFINTKRQLYNTLVDNYELAPSEFDYPVFSAYSSAVIKPTYGKDSWFNSAVINHQTYFSVGGGIAAFEKTYTYDEPTQELAYSVRIGAGRKYFLNSLMALNFEVEETFAFKEAEVTKNLQLNIGLDIRFNLGRARQKDNNDLEALYKYLEGEK